VGAGIMAAIGGGLSESGFGGGGAGIIYGTGAGYKSGIRAWGGVTWQTARLADRRFDVPVGVAKSRDLPVEIQRARIPTLRQDVADAIESGVFGQVTGPYNVYQEPELQEELLVAKAQADAQRVRTGRFVGAPPTRVACNYQLG